MAVITNTEPALAVRASNHAGGAAPRTGAAPRIAWRAHRCAIPLTSYCAFAAIWTGIRVNQGKRLRLTRAVTVNGKALEPQASRQQEKLLYIPWLCSRRKIDGF
jgi:hypothetical protein